MATNLIYKMGLKKSHGYTGVYAREKRKSKRIDFDSRKESKLMEIVETLNELSLGDEIKLISQNKRLLNMRIITDGRIIAYADDKKSVKLRKIAPKMYRVIMGETAGINLEVDAKERWNYAPNKGISAVLQNIKDSDIRIYEKTR